MRRQVANLYINSTEHKLELLSSRVLLLEEKVFKKVKRLQATEAQRFLLFYHLGVIDGIYSLPISKNQKDLYLSVMLDIDPDNGRKFLSELGKKTKPLLETISNYTFLADFFESIKDNKREAEAAAILTRIQKQKEKLGK